MLPVQVLGDYVAFEADERTAGFFPNAKASPPYAAVEFTWENVFVLRNLGYDCPSPIYTKYDWPIRSGRKPRWYQKDSAAFMSLNKRAFCLNSCRTGKTSAALWAMDCLKKAGYIRKTLIVAPLSTLDLVWGTDIFADFWYRKYAVLYGSAKKRKELLASDADVYIINHDGVEIIKDELKKRTDIDLIIIDEVAVYRNSQTTRWKTMKEIIKPHQWVWGLTGTPTSNAPSDAFGIFKLIKPENYDGHFTRFKNHVMMQVGPFRWVPRPGAEQIVNQVLQPSIRFPRSVNTDMEPCLIERKAELSSDQQKHYKALINQAVTMVGSTQVTAVNAAVLLSKLCQVALGVAYGANGEIAEMDFGPRYKVLEELIEENNEKVIVFVSFTAALDALAEKLKKRWSVAVVDGGVSVGKRNQIFKAFQQDKDPHVLVCHPQCMAHGLNLAAASLSVWFSPTCKNEIYEQANARTDGAAQKVKIDIAHIWATKEEKAIFDTVRSKGKLQSILLKMVEENR